MDVLGPSDPARQLSDSILNLLDKHDGRDALAALALSLATTIAYALRKDPGADCSGTRALRDDLLEFAVVQLQDRNAVERES